jgi:hypothetical protein
MLVIRDAQLDLLKAQTLERFEDDLVQSLAQDFEPKVALLGEDAVRRLIRRAIAFGHDRGIRNQGAVAVLAELMLQFGDRFECSPDRRWAEAILGHPTLPDHIRVDLARQRMMARTGGRTLMPAGAPAPESRAGA